MRGRLIFPFIAELCRFTGTHDEDPDFKEPLRVDRDNDGLGTPPKLEASALRIPCQVDSDVLEAVRMSPTGRVAPPGGEPHFPSR